MPETFDTQCKIFLGHAAAVLGCAIWALIAPLYLIATSQGEQYVLTISGWSGDAAAAFALGTTNSNDYTSIGWALAISLGGCLVFIVRVLARKNVSQGMWEVLALLAWCPVIVACVFLGMDGFPMPAFSAFDARIDTSIIAGWVAPLWALAVAAGLVLGGTIAASRVLPAVAPAPNIHPAFFDDIAFRRLQAELIARRDP